MFIYILAFLMSASAQFFDEDQPFEQCLGEQFQCYSGLCIDQERYCDGRVDCDDGTDENYCVNHNADQGLCNATHQFLCHDGHHCIPNPWICNGIGDCDDASDEDNCTDFVLTANATCKGFQCKDGACVSKLWACDGVYDCKDRSDEYDTELCKHSLLDHNIVDGSSCGSEHAQEYRSYQCSDASFCLPAEMMCDGIADCKDASDEGDFCKHWSTMCSNHTCHDESHCVPDRSGPTCDCKDYLQYNTTTLRCEDVDECQQRRPHCSHKCVNAHQHFSCQCDDGYVMDKYGYLCFARGPEAMLFFSTHNEIKFLKVKSKVLVTVATGIKQAHGISYDGKYLYWVEMAQGHQSIVRAHLEDIDGTKEVLVALGLEEPGDVSIDWLGQNLYFGDSLRGIISVCKLDASHCATVKTDAKHPKYVIVEPKYGKMYWADYHGRPVIMTANMDGSNPAVLVDHLESFATGLAMDTPNRRLYYVDKTVKVVMVDNGQGYSLFSEVFHRPYAVAVFESTVYWSEWSSRTIQTTDKMNSARQNRNILVTLDAPVFGMHIYHPVLMPTKNNPCANHNCSHICLLSSESSHVCACPEGMELKGTECQHISGYKPQHLVICGGQLFTRFDYNTLGNPETHATFFDVGRVQAMAYDSFRDTLYLYDGQRRSINYINMSDFSLGLTRMLVYQGLDNVVDMDYDYASDSLYVVDAGRRHIEVISLRTYDRAVVYKFRAMELPIAFCLVPDYGTMLVAVVESDHHNIYIESIGLDGTQRRRVIMNNLKGPHVRLRYNQNLNVVFISDEGNGIIDFMHPEGTGRENYRELSTSVTSLAIADTYVFWTDRRTPRLFWSDIHESTHRVRRINLSLFPNNTQLLVQSTSVHPDPSNPLLYHPCLKAKPCPGVCVQSPSNNTHNSMGYKCLCPAGYFMDNNLCVKMVSCKDHEFYCHRSNACVDKTRVCDGNKDCKFEEDELHCRATPAPIPTSCNTMEFQCHNSTLCVPRAMVCDQRLDCPDGSDETSSECDSLQCLDTEFTCASGSCILKTWKCDGDEDCNDASDEVDCEKVSCKPGFFQCRSRECIEVKKRCDGTQDCFDYSDEEDCEEAVIVDVEEASLPHCEDYEFACELDKSICLPLTARCNLIVECPGSTDENNCDLHCAPRGMFQCKQQMICVRREQLCNGRKDCTDGSDETPEACLLVNRTSHLYPVLRPAAECRDGFMCKNGECIEWREVCDNKPHCYDLSDEGGHCSSACTVHNCAVSCQPTPLGPQCTCPEGYRVSLHGAACEDIDECATEACSQTCRNTPGGFICGCHHGYALRSDRRSCKAMRGNMLVLYVSGNTVRSVSADGLASLRYSDSTVSALAGLDVNVRTDKLYITSTSPGKLIEVNSTQDAVEVTNIGRPTKLSVEWVTGNVYFVDSTPGAACIRVCNVWRKRCAKLQTLPSDATIPSLIVDPKSRLMFYCVTSGLESVVWSASLSGHNAKDLTTVRNCTGLAVDSFLGHLYVAETGPPQIIRMNYFGDSHKKILTHHQLQAPHGLAIFEDHIYYLVANSFRLGRCLMYGAKHCETFLYRVFDANTFVIHHESVQRDDISNDCDVAQCDNVCVLGENGAICVCNDGTVAKDGTCKLVEKSLLPLFNGWSYQDYMSAHHTSFTIIAIVLVLLVVYLSMFVYYHFVYKPRRVRDSAYTEVRFQSNVQGTGAALSYIPALDMASDGSISHEFVNPLQFVKNMWRQSTRKTHPVGTAGLNIDVSPLQNNNYSDTESIKDEREKLIFINN